MADALNMTLNLGKLTYSDQGTVGFANFTIDGSTDEAALCFQAEDPITITRLGFRVNTITGTPGTLTISLQAIDTASFNPSGTILGGGSPASVAVSAAGLTPGAFNWVTLDNSYTCTRGQALAIKIDPTSGTWDASNSIVVGISVSGFGTRPGIPYALQAPSGAYAAVTGYPVYGYSSSSRVYGYPVSSVDNTAYDSGTTPDEVGMAFTVPTDFWSTYKIKGVRLLLSRPGATGQTTLCRLYSGTTVLHEATIDSEHYGTGTTGSGYRLCEWFFPESSLSPLSAGSVYRIVITPQGTSGDISVPGFTFANATDMQAMPLGENAYATSRVDAGSFSDTTTKRYYMELFFDDITAPSGGGGSVSGSVFGGGAVR